MTRKWKMKKKKIILKQKHLEMLKSVAGHNLAIIKERARDKLEKQQVEKKLTEANSAIDKMNENNFLIAQRKRREDAIKNINENFSLVQENEKIAEQKKQAETEEAFKALKNERLKKERLQQYIMAELPKMDKKTSSSYFNDKSGRAWLLPRWRRIHPISIQNGKTAPQLLDCTDSSDQIKARA